VCGQPLTGSQTINSITETLSASISCTSAQGIATVRSLTIASEPGPGTWSALACPVTPGYGGGTLTATCSNSDCPGTAPTLVCPAIPFPNTAPDAPVVTGPVTFTAGTTQTFTFTATDPQNDQLRYGIDWNNDGVADLWTPANVAYVNSGTAQLASYSWTAGAHTFQVLAQDAPGLNSPWTPYGVAVTAPTVVQPSLPDLTADPVTSFTATANVPVTISALVKNIGTAATGSGFPVFFQVASAAGGSGTITDLSSATLPMLAAGENTSASKLHTFDAAGTYSVRVCANKSNSSTFGSVNEGTGTDNNCSFPWTDVTVTAPAAAVGTWSALSCSTHPGYAGGTLTATCSNTNCSGTAPTLVCPAVPLPNTAPDAPVVTGPVTFTAGTTQTFSFTATDSQNDQIRYGVDWNNDNVADLWLPAGVTYVDSGTSQSDSYSWTAGTHTFQVLAQDTPGLNSAWAPYTVTVTAPVVAQPSLPNLTADPVTSLTATAGTAAAFSALVRNIGTVSTGASFPTFFQVASASGGGGTVTDLPSATLPTLAAGDNTTASATYTFPAAGTYSVRVCANKTDSATFGAVNEGTSTGDNCSAPWTDVTVTAPVSVPTLTLQAYCFADTSNLAAKTACSNSGNSISLAVSQYGLVELDWSYPSAALTCRGTTGTSGSFFFRPGMTNLNLPFNCKDAANKTIISSMAVTVAPPPALSTAFTQGDRVVIANNSVKAYTNYYFMPPTETALTEVALPAGAHVLDTSIAGTVKAGAQPNGGDYGPYHVDGHWWWYVEFDNGVNGLVREDGLTKYVGVDKLSGGDGITLTHALERISQSWDQPSVDIANSILFKTSYTATDWEGFFRQYLISERHVLTDSLIGYLLYPTALWGSDQTRKNLQDGELPVLWDLMHDTLAVHSSDLETYLGDSAHFQTIFNSAKLMQGIGFGDRLQTGSWRPTLFSRFTSLVNTYPQYFKDGDISASMPHVATARAQVWMAFAEYGQYTATSKADIAATLGLSGWYLTMWNNFSVLVHDNKKLDTHQQTFMHDLLNTVPPSLHDLHNIIVPLNFVNNAGLGENGGGLTWDDNIAVPPTVINPSETLQNFFPTDVSVASVYSDWFSGVIPHELNHVVNFYRINADPSLRNRLAELLNQAGTATTLQYFRSNTMGNDPTVFRRADGEFFASMANNYFPDSYASLDLVLKRFDSGYREPLNQFLFFFNVYSAGGAYSRFYTIQHANYDALSEENIPLTRDGNGNVTGFTVPSQNMNYTFTLDTNGNVTGYTKSSLAYNVNTNVTGLFTGLMNGLRTMQGQMASVLLAQVSGGVGTIAPTSDVIFTADRTSVVSGQSATVNWSVPAGYSCVITSNRTDFNNVVVDNVSAACPLGDLPNITAGEVAPANTAAGTPTPLFAYIRNVGAASTHSDVPYFFQVATASGGTGSITDLPPSAAPVLAAKDTAPVYATHTFSTVGTYSVRVCANKTDRETFGPINEGVTGTGDNCSLLWTDVVVSPAGALCQDNAAPNFGKPLPCVYTTCQDSAAKNFGGSLPCTYTTATCPNKGKVCTQTNSCGMQNAGFTQCEGVVDICPVGAPADSTCATPDVSVTTSPALVNPGGSCTINWNITNATSCTLSSDIADPALPKSASLPSGSYTSPNLTTPATYTLVCHNGDVVTMQKSTSCRLNPTFREL